MEAIKIEVTGNIAKVIEKPLRITAGTVGLPVEFVFDSHWDNMTKVAVFNTGIVKKNMKIVGNATVVPIEALAVPELNLSIGVYGVSEDGSVATPTVWASVGQIRHGAVPGSSFGSDIGTAKKYYDLGEQAAEKADASAKKAESDADRAEAAVNSANEIVGNFDEQAQITIRNIQGFTNNAYEAARDANNAADRAEEAAERAESAGGGSPNIHAEYFTITENGVLSVKDGAELPEYLVIPEVVDGVMVDSLANELFKQNLSVKQVVLPSTITALPQRCFSQCSYLTDVYNTEGITDIGPGCFQATAIKRASFPNLKTLGENAFYCCGHLVYADIGSVDSIPELAFERCTALNAIKYSGTIRAVHERAFRSTPRLKKAGFLGDLWSIGQYAFYGSKVDYDWQALKDKNCYFSTNATSLQLNPTDFWSALAFTPCENPAPTHLSQYNPLWADVAINEHDTYSTGCSLFCDMHIYCGIKGLTLTDPREFVAIVNEKYPDWLTKDIGYVSNDALLLSKLLEGTHTVTHYTEYNATTLQAVYDALAAGGYVLATVGIGAKTTGHAVIICGIDANGELIVVDSLSNTYDDRGVPVPKYSLHYKKFLAPSGYSASGGFLIVRPNGTQN